MKVLVTSRSFGNAGNEAFEILENKPKDYIKGVIEFK